MGKLPPQDKLKLYDRLIDAHPAAERQGAAMPHTSLHGNVYSFLTKEGTLALRLPERQRSAFLRKYQAALCEQMPEFVQVPESLLKKTDELSPYFADSYLYAGRMQAALNWRKEVADKAAASGITIKKKSVQKKAPKKKRAATHELPKRKKK